MEILDIIQNSYFSEDEDYVEKITPEKCLLVAILQRAIGDLQDKNKKFREDAVYWFRYNGQEEIWGSYLYICYRLNIEDPIFFKKQIFKICKENKNGKISDKAGRLSRRAM